jgi:peroxiredoxin
MIRALPAILLYALVAAPLWAADDPAPPPAKVGVGEPAPAFQFKDQGGNLITLADLTAKGPVLVRLTCGCAGCDKELAYFQEIDAAYRKAGLTTVAIFKEPDEKVAKYAADKKINMVYGVDAKGEAWKTFQTTAMPTNVLIGKDGKIIAITNGCDPSGLLAKKVSEKIAQTLQTDAIDVKSRVEEKKDKK